MKGTAHVVKQDPFGADFFEVIQSWILPIALLSDSGKRSWYQGESIGSYNEKYSAA